MTGEVSKWNIKDTHCNQRHAHLTFVLKSRIEQLEKLKTKVHGNSVKRNTLNKEIAHRDITIKNLNIKINTL
tara:strand:+ start:544 stop:759 length:216 start_codon:yes stop_codon:yes gene_type:complete